MLSHIKLFFHVIVLILITFISVFTWLTEGVFAISPSFNRQEINDNHYHDTIFVNDGEVLAGEYYKNRVHELNLTDTNEFFDLFSATYFSDGNILDTTLWLDKAWNETLFENGSRYHTIAFGILVDVDNNKGTGFEYFPGTGFEYMVQLVANDKNWSKIIGEFTSSGRMRVLDIENQVKDPLDLYKTSIPLTLDLEILNYPSAYRIEFFVKDTFVDRQGKQISLTDTVGPVLIKSLSEDSNQLASHVPTSSDQEIRDPGQDRIQINLNNLSNMKLHQQQFPLDESVEIEGIKFSTERNVLSATLWLNEEVPLLPWLGSNASKLLYGILINADSNQKTGVDGVDYQLEIQWDNNTATWTKMLAEYSSDGHQKFLEIEENFKIDNLFDPYSSSDEYALLSLNLDTIALQDEYKVLFYAEVIYGKPSAYMTIDFSNWVDVPSSSYYISTSATPLSIRKGSETTIGLQLRTASGVVPDVINFIPSQNPSVLVTFNPMDENIRSYGSESLAPFSIRVNNNAQIGEYTIPIIANISEESVYPSKFLKLNYTDLSLPTLGYRTTSANLTVDVLESLSPSEQFKNFWDVYGDPISLVAGGFAAGFSALVFDRMNKKRKEKNYR